MWVLRSGVHCKACPPPISSPSTRWRRLRTWEEQEGWLTAALPRPKKGALRRRRQEGQGYEVEVGGQGVPLGNFLESASAADVNLIERTLARVSAPRRGRPKQKPDRLTDDKAADALRKRLRAWSIDLICPLVMKPPLAFTDYPSGAWVRWRSGTY